MGSAALFNAQAAERARAWTHATLAASCDVIEPWDHGTVIRATRYPSYYDLNLVRVERPVSMGVEELIAFADEALAGLQHRLIAFDDADAAASLRPGFERSGWRALRLVWMRHANPLPPGPATAVEEVPYDAVGELRIRWHHEDFPGVDPSVFHAQAREVALRRGARVLAAHDGTAPIAFAQLEHHGDGAEISEVYVRPDRRGAGLGTAVTRAAIAAARDARDLWISADDEDRPKHLYQRLGFRPARTVMHFLRLP